ncbi:MAG TPA: M48 family metalloprotease [Anaeromyxobacteraceae bacterium]|nr:M48 family metalloprotease [Anaeromyxobacteraceae bacterium]
MPHNARALLLALLVAGPAGAAAAQPIPLPPPPPAASGASGRIDPEAATRAYLDQVPPATRARSDAYAEGGYWLSLFGFLWTAGSLLLLLFAGTSARMRDRAERLARPAGVRAAIYGAQFMIALSVLSFPLELYRDHYREHQYGLSNLTLGGWLAEEAKGLALAVVLGGLGVGLLYAIVRRAGKAWWLWGAVAATAFLAFLALVTPVLIVPIFNEQKPLADARVVKPILAIARANGIRAAQVWEVDASKQTRRISANVAGLLGTERITLNDNLLARASLPEVEAVMAHEMGHYVLHHIYKGLLEFGVLAVAGFGIVATLFERLRRRYEARWRVRGIADPAGLPLAALLFSSYFFVLTPIVNTLGRTAEYEADLFGLNAAGQPDGFARAALHLAEYRKLEPGPFEEAIFYDHPSGRTRIHAAMRWKAGHPESWGAPGGGGDASSEGGASPR